MWRQAQVRALHTVPLYQSWGTSSLGNSNLFLVCNQTCPTFVPGGEILIILDSKPVCPLLQWETICLFSEVIHLGVLWKIVWNKGYQCLYSKGVQKSGWFGTKFSHEVTIKLGLLSSIGLTGPKDLLPWSFRWLLARLSSSLLFTRGLSYLPHVPLSTRLLTTRQLAK